MIINSKLLNGTLSNPLLPKGILLVNPDTKVNIEYFDYKNLTADFEIQSSSLLEMTIFNFSSDIDLSFDLKGDNSKLELKIFNFIKSDSIKVNINALIDSSFSESKISIWSIIFDETDSTVDSCITIRENSKESYGEIMQSNIFTDNNGRINSLPRLDIRTKDSSAKHSLIGECLNEDNLFYLVSRGIPLDEAKKIHIMNMISSNINNKIIENSNYLYKIDSLFI